MHNIIHRPINRRKFAVYVRKLEKAGKLFRYKKFVFDLESMMSVNYACDPGLCLKVTDGHYHGSCCTDYSVDLSHGEKLALISLLEKSIHECAVKYPWLLTGKIFKRNRNKTHYLAHRPEGPCVFGKIEGNRILCIVDLLCAKLKLKRTMYKPSTCFSWPFELIDMENSEKEVFVTFINAVNAKYMSQDTACLKCVSGQHGAPAYISMKSEIEHYTGKKAYKAMLKAIGAKKPCCR